MKESLLCCSVCGQPLTFDEKNARCPKGHCFDRAARGGYVHLPVSYTHLAQVYEAIMMLYDLLMHDRKPRTSVKYVSTTVITPEMV